MPTAGGICLGAGDLATDPAGRLAIHPGHALDLALAGAATLAGLGITKLPENVVRADLTDGRLERVPPQGNAPPGNRARGLSSPSRAAPGGARIDRLSGREASLKHRAVSQRVRFPASGAKKEQSPQGRSRHPRWIPILDGFPFGAGGNCLRRELFSLVVEIRPDGFIFKGKKTVRDDASISRYWRVRGSQSGLAGRNRSDSVMERISTVGDLLSGMIRLTHLLHEGEQERAEPNRLLPLDPVTGALDRLDVIHPHRRLRPHKIDSSRPVTSPGTRKLR